MTESSKAHLTQSMARNPFENSKQQERTLKVGKETVLRYIDDLERSLKKRASPKLKLKINKFLKIEKKY
jgi:hypothetical protein